MLYTIEGRYLDGSKFLYEVQGIVKLEAVIVKLTDSLGYACLEDCYRVDVDSVIVKTK